MLLAQGGVSASAEIGVMIKEEEIANFNRLSLKQLDIIKISLIYLFITLDFPK